MAAFSYSRARGQYRNTETGRWVSDLVVRAEIDRLADAASGRLAALTEQMRHGDLTLAEWQKQAMATIKVSNVAAGVIASGGKAQMTPSAYGFLGSQVKGQYQYLRDMANGIADGTVPLDGRLVSRAGMYGQAARVSFEAVRARDAADRGMSEEMNVLHAKESCAECSGLSGMGWVELGTLPPIGSRTCLSNCRCTISRRSAGKMLRLLRAAS